MRETFFRLFFIIAVGVAVLAGIKLTVLGADPRLATGVGAFLGFLMVLLGGLISRPGRRK